MIRYCAGQHDGAVLISTPEAAGPHCCDHCADPDKPEACPCDDVSAPHMGNLPDYHPLAAKR